MKDCELCAGETENKNKIHKSVLPRLIHVNLLPDLAKHPYIASAARIPVELREGEGRRSKGRRSEVWEW